jgi:hypothetical protein
MMAVVLLTVSSGCRRSGASIAGDIVGRAPRVKHVRNGGEFLPEYMRFVAWKSSHRLIRGIRLSQRRKAVANAVAIDYILARN